MGETLKKQLLIVAHSPSPNTEQMRNQLYIGADTAETSNIETTCLSPFDTTPDNVLTSDAIILFTPENLGYMSGAIKDWFDRIYYPCLEQKQGLPYALCIRAGHDGTGTTRAIETITTGLRWRLAQPTLLCKGSFQEDFLTQCRDLGAYMAIALDNGVL